MTISGAIEIGRRQVISISPVSMLCGVRYRELLIPSARVLTLFQVEHRIKWVLVKYGLMPLVNGQPQGARTSTVPHLDIIYRPLRSLTMNKMETPVRVCGCSGDPGASEIRPCILGRPKGIAHHSAAFEPLGRAAS